jgi:hypothetical protein
MQAGDTFRAVVTVKTTAGVLTDGLASGTFTVTTYFNGSAVAATATITGIGGGTGRYHVAITTPVTLGWHQVFITNSGYVVESGLWLMELEAQDNDSLYALVAAPAVSALSAARIGAKYNLTMNARRRAAVTMTVQDQNGAVLDLSGYSTYRFTVWDSTHSGGSAFYTLSSGITGSALGVLAFTVPETAAFFTQMDTAISAGQDEVIVFYDVIADAGGVAGNTEKIVGGTITLTRWEGTV